MFQATIVELSAALQARRLSCVELTKGLLDRIARLNPTLNAFITVDPERALSDAQAGDAALAAGRAGPLTGFGNSSAWVQSGNCFTLVDRAGPGARSWLLPPQSDGSVY